MHAGDEKAYNLLTMQILGTEAIRWLSYGTVWIRLYADRSVKYCPNTSISAPQGQSRERERYPV